MRTASLVFCGVLAASPARAQPGVDPYPPPQPYPQPQPPPYQPPYQQPPPYQPPPQQYGPPVAPAYAQPSPGQQQPIAGGARATFVSTSEKRWDVRLDSNAVCTTPCALYVEPGRFVTMHLQDMPRSKLSVGYIPPGDFVVTAKPRSEGAFATGVTFTTLGGAAVVTGITLTAVGCSTDRSGMCTAGLVTGLAGAAVTAFSVNLIRNSLPKAAIGPATAQPYMGGNQVGVTGSF